MTGFQPMFFGIGSDHAVNWATTTARIVCLYVVVSLNDL